MIESPDELTVTCDSCGTETCIVPVTELCGEPPSFTIDETDLPEGWEFDGGEFSCPECREE